MSGVGTFLDILGVSWLIDPKIPGTMCIGAMALLCKMAISYLVITGLKRLSSICS